MAPAPAPAPAQAEAWPAAAHAACQLSEHRLTAA